MVSPVGVLDGMITIWNSCVVLLLILRGGQQLLRRGAVFSGGIPTLASRATKTTEELAKWYVGAIILFSYEAKVLFQ